MEKESQDHLVSSLPYQDTMEHRAASLVGQKLAAAQLLYGDSVEGALVEQSDSGHGFLADLARSVIERAAVTDLSHLFRQVSMVGGNGHEGGQFIGSLLPSIESDSEVAVGVAAALGEPVQSLVALHTRQMSLF